VGEIASLVRASDAFESLTIGAADGISKQAEERKRMVQAVRSPEVDAAIAGGATKQQLASLAARIEHEAAAQVRFADWLRGLAGEKGGDNA